MSVTPLAASLALSAMPESFPPSPPAAAAAPPATAAAPPAAATPAPETLSPAAEAAPVTLSPAAEAASPAAAAAPLPSADIESESVTSGSGIDTSGSSASAPAPVTPATASFALSTKLPPVSPTPLRASLALSARDASPSAPVPPLTLSSISLARSARPSTLSSDGELSVIERPLLDVSVRGGTLAEAPKSRPMGFESVTGCRGACQRTNKTGISARRTHFVTVEPRGPSKPP